jgi:hypothetical protein
MLHSPAECREICRELFVFMIIAVSQMIGQIEKSPSHQQMGWSKRFLYIVG